MTKAKYSIFTLLLILLLSLPHTAFGENKREYYTDLLESWGLNIRSASSDELENENVASGITNVLFENAEIEALSRYEGGSANTFYLLFTSVLEDLGTDFLYEQISYDRFLIVCDTAFALEGVFSCSDTSITTQNAQIIELGQNKELSNKTVSVGYFEEESISGYVVLENDLATPDVRNMLKQFFNATSKSNQVDEFAVVAPVSALKAGLADLVSSGFYGIFIALLFTFLLLIVFKQLVLEIFYNPKHLFSTPFYQNKLLEASNKLSKLKGLFALLFVSLFSVYILVLSFISIRQIGELDKRHILDLVSFSLKSSNVQSAVLGGNLIVPAIYAANLILLLLFALMVLPGILALVSYTIKELSKKPSKRHFSHKILMLLISLSVLLVSIFDLQQIYKYLIGLLLLILYVVHTKEPIEFKVATFGRNIKSFVLLLFVAVIGVWLYSYKQNIPPEIQSEELFGTSSAVVVLPYQKQHGSNVIFNDFITDVDAPVFVDNYIIYHPEYSIVANIPIQEFLPTESFAILRPNSIHTYRDMLFIQELADILQANSVKKTFMFSNASENLESQQHELNITVDCSKSSEDAEVRLFATNSEISVEENIMYFPGCLPTQDQAIYSISLRSRLNKVLVGDSVLASITTKDDDPFEILSLEYKVNGVSVPLRFFEDFGYQKVLYINEADSTSIKVYSADIQKNYTFSRTTTSMNLSEVVNVLKKNDVLPNPFLIWSPQNNLIIKNEL